MSPTARPDRRPRVAFATAPASVIGPDDVDRPLHEVAADAAGIDLEHPVWSDPDVAWDAYDLVVVRSTWDYLDHLAEFGDWLRSVDRRGTLHNPAEVIAWNLDKRYLEDLADAGVVVVPTRVCRDAAEVGAALEAAPGEVVVKPVVSAGSRLTGRFESTDPAAGALARSVLEAGTAVLVQPAVASVAEVGEVSTVLFGGSVSHSARKGPLLAPGGGLIGGGYAERLAPEVLTAGRREAVEAASTAVARIVGRRFGVTRPLLYARVDLVTLDDGTEAVLEVELAEPAFFLGTDPAAAGRFAAAVAARVAAGR